MKEFRLHIVWIESVLQPDGSRAMETKENVFVCSEQDGRLVIPPDADRLMRREYPRAMSVKTVEWIGDAPTHLYKCGAKTDEEAAQLSQQANSQAEFAMSLLNDTEPEAKPNVMDMFRPKEGPIHVIGEADIENDAPLLNKRGE